MTIGMAYVNRKVSGIEWGNNGPSRGSCSSDSQLEKNLDGRKRGRELEDVFRSFSSPYISLYCSLLYIQEK